MTELVDARTKPLALLTVACEKGAIVQNGSRRCKPDRTAFGLLRQLSLPKNHELAFDWMSHFKPKRRSH
jgi:hypothetical protein